MKKFIALVGVLVLVLLATWLPAGAADQNVVNVYQNNQLVKSVVFKIGVPEYVVNGQTPGVKMDVAPFIQDGRTFVPIRFLGNALGVTDQNIAWDIASQTATLKSSATLQMTIGQAQVVSNGLVQAIDVAPVLANGRTFLPGRYVAEGLGYQVQWDAATQTVVCWPAGQPEPDVSGAVSYLNGQQAQQNPQQNQPGQSQPITSLSDDEIKQMQSYPTFSGSSGSYISFDQMQADPKDQEYANDVYKMFNPNMIPGQISEYYYRNIPDNEKFEPYIGATMSWVSNPRLVYCTDMSEWAIRGILQVNFPGQNSFNLTPGQTYERDVEFRLVYGFSSGVDQYGEISWKLTAVVPLSDFRAVRG